MRIINNADDFGYSPAINYGIIESYLQGVLTSTTIMPAMMGFDHAIALAKANPGLGIGVHLTLTCGKPLLKGHQTLVDENGNFKKLAFYQDATTSISDEEVYAEWKAQIEKVYQAGIQPTHLDSHHHIHTFKNNPSIVKKLAKEYNLPVRNSFADKTILTSENIQCNDILIDPWKNLGDKIENIEDKVKVLSEEIISLVQEASLQNEIIEVMWHPAYLDYKILTESSFAYPRVIEAEAIKQKDLVKYMKDNFELCTYQNISKGEEKNV
ncbi:MAG: carbohydrate deacetylase [Longibaculum muris]|uniref:Carbohydrate deacetylase n=1 Tax=Longibaculum muris TaxID=1796628 RepID=A0A4R3Z5J0_9FIRM|nr:carbohydrate deacetylase [Longibaculum muris]KXU45308.1 YdjC-like protein [Candidatus Stoquefichus sp. KLE1796]MBS5368570.1 carbohydrate deacetylase [Coprobacillus cateniformis]MCR1886663.1 carbohydrate deacetylase [Longibaculum muris]MED9813138.1 carbohydrate deacetylase [Longibaculum muris]TCW01718.1 hypothetical protein EDD60_103175 [Longibaculum muris]